MKYFFIPFFFLIIFSSGTFASDSTSVDCRKKYEHLIDSLIYKSLVNASVDTFLLSYALRCDFEISRVDTVSEVQGVFLFFLTVFDNDNIRRKIIRFYENGALSAISSVHSDELDGVHIGYSPNGKITYIEQGVFANSIGIDYYEDGSIRSYAKSVTNWPVEMYFYYPSGSLCEICKYFDDGTRLIKEYREFGHIKSEAECNGRREFHGKRILYNKKGKPKKVEYYRNGLRSKPNSKKLFDPFEDPIQQIKEGKEEVKKFPYFILQDTLSNVLLNCSDNPILKLVSLDGKPVETIGDNASDYEVYVYKNSRHRYRYDVYTWTPFSDQKSFLIGYELALFSDHYEWKIYNVVSLDESVLDQKLNEENCLYIGFTAMTFYMKTKDPRYLEIYLSSLRFKSGRLLCWKLNKFLFDQRMIDNDSWEFGVGTFDPQQPLLVYKHNFQRSR
jgi:hypothetical protein